MCSLIKVVPILSVLVLPCLARRVEVHQAFVAPVAQRTQFSKVEVPSPDFFEANFELIDFAKAPYANQMLLNGRLNRTNSQLVWGARYWEFLLAEASDKLSQFAEKKEFHRILSAVEAIPRLSDAVLFNETAWETIFLPKLHTAQALLVKDIHIPEEAQLKELLDRLEKQFMLDMSEPQVMFYLGMTDKMSVEYAKPSASIHVSLLDTLSLHSIDQATARDKTDGRSLKFAEFFENVSKLGLSNEEWNMEELLDKYGDEGTKEALGSVTPILTFNGTQKGKGAYILMEGNGRVCAMKMALDKVRLKDPTFAAPKITVANYEFDGPEIARRNRNFFLDLAWRNFFPAVEIPGWRPVVTNSVRKVSKEFEVIVKSRPRYFGQVPLRIAAYSGP